jgi:hypothetical protein
MSFLRNDDNSQDLLEGVDAAGFDPDQIKRASYILRRPYGAIDVVEIDAYIASEQDLPIPYFVVQADGASYDLLGMGRGELAAMYLLWRLDRVEPGSIVLLDEPEAHLAQFSQKALLEALVACAVEKDVQLVISSHYPEVFSLLEDDAVWLLSGSPFPRVTDTASNLIKAEFLGVIPSVTGLLVCEDYVGASTCLAILRNLYPEIARRVDVRYLETGESGVIDLLGRLRNVATSGIAVAGVLDGDQRGTTGVEAIGFLPGKASPESTIRECLEEWRRGGWADWDGFGSSRESLMMNLEQLDGVENHDWLSELGKRLGGTSAAVALGVSVMLKDEVLRRQAEELAQWVAKAIKAN